MLITSVGKLIGAFLSMALTRHNNYFQFMLKKLTPPQFAIRFDRLKGIIEADLAMAAQMW